MTSREGSRISRANRAPALKSPELAWPIDDQGEAEARSGDQSRETDLPAEQIGAQAPSRLSRSYGDQGRPEGRRSAARTRAQATQCVTRAPIPIKSLPNAFPWSG